MLLREALISQHASHTGLSQPGIVNEACVVQAANIKDMYDATRREGLNAEVKRRILMGTYALSAGYYDAYYKRAQQVGRRHWVDGLLQRSFYVRSRVSNE